MGKEGDGSFYITVQDDVTSHSSSGPIKTEYSLYTLILMMCHLFSGSLLPTVRPGIMAQNDNKPPEFGSMVNGVFLSMFGVTLCVNILVTCLLICANYFKFSWMKERYLKVYWLLLNNSRSLVTYGYDISPGQTQLDWIFSGACNHWDRNCMLLFVL